VRGLFRRQSRRGVAAIRDPSGIHACHGEVDSGLLRNHESAMERVADPQRFSIGT
jgi:hypothetical protein